MHRVVLPNRQTAWLVTRYDDAVAALKDARLVKDRTRATAGEGERPPWVPSAFRPLTRNLLDLRASSASPSATVTSSPSSRAIRPLTPSLRF